MNHSIPDGVFTDAVRHYWIKRGAASPDETQAFAGRRSEAVGGKQLDGFLYTIKQTLVSEGVAPEEIHVKRSLTYLPGYYRATKMWDLLVVRDEQLKAVVELKAQAGPSFGNNFNNRAEEAIGNAVDLWRAYQEGAYLESSEPWVGYLFLLEDCEASRSSVGVTEPHYPVDRAFIDASYAKRYELLLLRLLGERLYSGACLLLSDPNRVDEDPNYAEPNQRLSASRFLEELVRRVV